MVELRLFHKVIGTAYAQMRKIQRIFLHQRFRSNNTSNWYDFAIIVLDKPVKFNEFISPIELPGRSTSKPGPSSKESDPGTLLNC